MDKHFDLKKLKSDTRTIQDMGLVFYDKDWRKKANPDVVLYRMYRGLEEKMGYRYDITTIPAIMLGKEFNKTKGHQHNNSYGEIYIVLEGRAIYLMQKENDSTIEDVYAVQAEKGDVCVIPPHYAHFTINPGSSEIKMANWVDKNCKSKYKEIQQKQGACYFYTLDGWIKNKNYTKIPPLRFEQALKSLPKQFSFLNE